MTSIQGTTVRNERMKLSGSEFRYARFGQLRPQRQRVSNLLVEALTSAGTEDGELEDRWIRGMAMVDAAGMTVICLSDIKRLVESIVVPKEMSTVSAPLVAPKVATVVANEPVTSVQVGDMLETKITDTGGIVQPVPRRQSPVMVNLFTDSKLVGEPANIEASPKKLSLGIPKDVLIDTRSNSPVRRPRTPNTPSQTLPGTIFRKDLPHVLAKRSATLPAVPRTMSDIEGELFYNAWEFS